MTFLVLLMKICNDMFEWNKTLNALFIVIQLYWFCPSRYVWHMLWFHYSGVYKKKLNTYCSLMCTMFSISVNINRISDYFHCFVYFYMLKIPSVDRNFFYLSMPLVWGLLQFKYVLIFRLPTSPTRYPELYKQKCSC